MQSIKKKKSNRDLTVRITPGKQQFHPKWKILKTDLIPSGIEYMLMENEKAESELVVLRASNKQS